VGDLAIIEHEVPPVRRGRGRETVYTNEIGADIADKVRSGATIEAACGSHGVDRDTFYHWRDTRDDFFGMVTRAYAEAELYYTAVLKRATELPVGSIEYKAAVEWLKRQRRALWGDVIDIRRIDVAALQNLLQSQHAPLSVTDQPAIEDGFDVL